MEKSIKKYEPLIIELLKLAGAFVAKGFLYTIGVLLAFNIIGSIVIG